MENKKTLSAFVLLALLLIQMAAFENCGQMTTNSTAGGVASAEANVTTPLNFGSSSINVMSVTAGSCGSNGYTNEPCVSVTICEPGTSTCRTIPNILLDTGSYGLRIFGSVLTSYGINLATAAASTGSPLLECAQFGTGALWGPVASAEIGLAGEPNVTAPIQVVNSTYTIPSASGTSDCPDNMTSPADAGYNGILGVGVLLYDCGSYCVSNSDAGIYFSCASTSSCVETTATLAQQVLNPIGVLPIDNNGLVLSFPSVTSVGVPSTVGTLTIGIGTRGNNVPGAVNVFNADEYANFTTNYNNTVDDESFIDSGSNALYFNSTLTQCTGNDAGFYCPAAQASLIATQQSQTTSVSEAIPFFVGNGDVLYDTYSSATDAGVFNNLAGTGESQQFDWGFPFFLGRNIYVGLDTKSSSLASGPYWAF